MTSSVAIAEPAVLGLLGDPCWDRFVEGHVQGWLCHLSGWQRVVERSFPHIKGQNILIRDGTRIRAGIPIYDVRSPVTGDRLVSAPFATLCTPLASSVEDLAALVDGVLQLARARHARYVEIRTMQPLAGPAAERLAVFNRFRHHELLIDGDVEQLKKRFDRSCVRQRIERAARSGLDTATVVDAEGLRAFYALYLKTRRRLGLPPQPYRFIESLWVTFAPSGMVEIELASREGTPVAGILLLKFKDRVSAEYLVSDERFRDLSPNQLLVWNAIRRAHDQGYRVFDFGRTDATNTTLMDFKRRWGTTVSDLPIYCYPPSHLAEMESPGARLRAALHWTVQHLPEEGDRWLGDLIYQHMG